MTKAGQCVFHHPSIPSLETRKLRAQLILEEALETVAAMGFQVVDKISGTWIFSTELEFLEIGENNRKIEPDIVGVADGIADLQVVNLGTAVAFGIDIEPVFNEVMRSNNTKFDWPQKELERLNPDVARAVYLGNNQWCVVNKHGKVMKPMAYTAPNIKPILDAQ